ncbi:DUF397 domain-containing protein [Streptomyces sp. NPDC045431]|uniref:DUF397 domain-containing protein n=1 Tax=Streptomyces sp. NPDC045431 TaxID=3155613 RepID=UPI0033F4EB3D
MRVQPSTGDPSELTWVKSSYSTNDGPACVEVAATTSAVHVRDSKNIPGPRLGFTPTTWADFVTYATGG